MALNGVTIFGVVRKRMDDLLRDFRDRLKIDQNGNPSTVFGAVTTLDNPDAYPGDGLVQLAAASAASDAELWEAVEFFYAQLDPNQSQGRYLERFHGIPRFGLAWNTATQTQQEYEAQIRQLINSGADRFDVNVIALRQDDVICASQIFSTALNPIEGLPAPSSMLVVRGQNVDYQALAQSIFNGSEFGLYDFLGDQSVQVNTDENGGCVNFRFQEACRIFIDIAVEGYRTNSACDVAITNEQIQDAVISTLKAFYDRCEFGMAVTSSVLRGALGAIEGFTVTDVSVRRRAPQLYPLGCDTSTATVVEIDGTAALWAGDTPKGCTFCTAETWCLTRTDCVQLQPWEFPDFDSAFYALVVTEPETC